MQILPLPAFHDNYIWLLHNDSHAAVVDPGDAAPVLDYLAHTDCKLDAILVTHRHNDHVGGVTELVARTGARVFGPAHEPIPARSVAVDEGSTVALPGLGVELAVFAVPGHTLGHVAYYGAGALFCGDTLFSAGCGRLFEGSPAQMHASLAKLAALPDDTLVCCAHEYTISNLRFAAAADPSNTELAAYSRHCEALRAAGRPTLPSRIGLEKQINPFLRADQAALRQAAEAVLRRPPADTVEALAALRAWKDVF